MRPSFHPRLINGPFDDPGLYIPFVFENRAVLFDLGDIHALSPRNILKISHVFVTHTHMDHFIGFDRLLRLFLGRDKILYIYGPQGLLKNVEGKLAGYSWNLVKDYTNRFILNVTEVRPDLFISKRYVCQDGFIATRPALKSPFSGALMTEPAATVSTVMLDHSLPCLGFSIKEQFHVNIIKDRVLSLGLEIGPWLKSFKAALYDQVDPESEFVITVDPEKEVQKTFMLDDLSAKIATITPGQKITYIADAGMDDANEKKMVDFAHGADHLFIEAAFLEKDRELAMKKCHLTARQAGTIAARAGVKQFTIFHFSPRYTGQEHLLQQEAREAFERVTSDA
ncbi:MAG: ribonuclease Z [Desulfobacterales bacterium]|nr:ribonuclease Z [Desulfobacterales bacterium]